ncbi:uncharacterized protein LOC141634521 [Silene latifolia]|uniref:uncharacterized protein LOC141634521 n=1 Tax=Silene latifolia TaxID=37657 RepID=UPI003D78477E
MTQSFVGRVQESIINCLSDELLMEILCRLPDCKFVIQCKCVCKRWAAMATDPWFISKFIAIKSKLKHQNLSIIMWYTPDFCHNLWNGDESFFMPSIFKPKPEDSYSFSPFPFIKDDQVYAKVKPVASCLDLLLYCRHDVKDKKYNHYITNVQTRQWIQLPSPPYFGRWPLIFGLICDTPLYSCNATTYRYSVVVMRLTAPSTKFTAHVFSSTTNKWCDRVLSLPTTCTLKGNGLLGTGFHSASGFCFDGKLHFNCLQGFFGFDQNNIEFDEDEIQCHFVQWPSGMLSLIFFRVGVSQEHLKLCTLRDNVGLRVWILKDYNKSIWMLQHNVESLEWVSRDSWMTKKFEMFPQLETMPANVLGFHPNNTDIIYVVVPGGIFLCNLSSRTLELACCIPILSSQ